MSVKALISDLGYNLAGWRSKRKVLVLESDDWGTVRMASKQAYRHLEQIGVPVETSAFNRYDTLESNADLEGLMEVLSSVKDKQGRPAIMTLNNIVGNPDFAKIKSANFESYFWERFDTTLAKYPAHDRVMALYAEGIEKQLFKPQFHGREHVNVPVWLADLRANERLAQLAFEWDMFSLPRVGDAARKMEYMDAMAYYSPADKAFIEASIQEGSGVFEQIWGFKSTSVIAPNYVWNPESEEIWQKSGITFIQSGKSQMTPIMGTSNRQPIRHYTGQTNRLGQVYMVRNVVLEPSINPAQDWVNTALKSVASAFLFGKPAVVNTHRVNYIGGLDTANGDRGLSTLRRFLGEIVKKWPDVEFMSSDELGELITKNKN